MGQQLREVFLDMDDEESGLVHMDKFAAYLQDDRVKSYMHALKINTSDATQLFHLLDVDDSGEVVIDEFVEGCMKLKGEAKSMDLHVMMCENRHHLSHFMSAVEDRFELIL